MNESTMRSPARWIAFEVLRNECGYACMSLMTAFFVIGGDAAFIRMSMEDSFIEVDEF